MKLLKLVVVTLLCLSLYSCILVVDANFDSKEEVDGFSARAERNSRFISDLSLGTSRLTVVSIMGEADIAEAFTTGDVDYQVLFYRTSQLHNDYQTTRDETTPLVFKDDRLVGWGDVALENFSE